MDEVSAKRELRVVRIPRQANKKVSDYTELGRRRGSRSFHFARL